MLKALLDGLGFVKKVAPATIKLAIVASVLGLVISNAQAATTATGVSRSDFIQREALPVIDNLTQQEISALVAEMAAVVNTDPEAMLEEVEQTPDYEAQSAQVVKTQVVETDVKTRQDIAKHNVVEGDSLDSIAEHYEVSAETIRWANNMDNSVIAVGKVLTIPPIDGVVYTVRKGDTADKLAKTYKTEASTIVAFNDAEVDGLPVGQKIVIPGGTKPAPVQTSNSGGTTSIYERFIARTGYNISNYTVLMRVTGGLHNGYYGGWCTWWASYRAAQMGNPVQPGWGNANTWDSGALSSGYYVGSVPKVGAVRQGDGSGQGHVSVVEEVSSDDKMIKFSDMNGIAGWGTAAKSNEWVPAAGFDYIYKR